MCRRVALIFAILFLLFLGVVGYIVYDITRAPAPGASVVASGPPTPAERQTAERTVQKLKEQVEAPPVEQPRRGRRRRHDRDPQPFELRVTEEEANELIRGLPEVRQQMKANDIEGLSVQFEEDRVVLSARVPVTGGVKARVSATERISARNGEVAFETEEVRVGSFPVPDRVRAQLERAFQKAAKDLNRQIHDVEEIRVTDGSLTVRGKR